MMGDFHCEVVGPVGDCAVLKVGGEVDVSTAPRLREQVLDLVGKGVLHVIVDMREVSFLDSTGLGVLVGNLKRLRTHDGSLDLVINAERILRVFRITGLSTVLPIHASVPDAIAAGAHWPAAVEGEAESTEEWCRRHGLL
jgi:anti-sigma B factor antagonist